MVKLVDALDSKSSIERCASSSLARGTIYLSHAYVRGTRLSLVLFAHRSDGAAHLRRRAAWRVSHFATLALRAHSAKWIKRAIKIKKHGFCFLLTFFLVRFAHTLIHSAGTFLKVFVFHP